MLVFPHDPRVLLATGVKLKSCLTKNVQTGKDMGRFSFQKLLFVLGMTRGELMHVKEILEDQHIKLLQTELMFCMV